MCFFHSWILVGRNLFHCSQPQCWIFSSLWEFTPISLVLKRLRGRCRWTSLCHRLGSSCPQQLIHRATTRSDRRARCAWRQRRSGHIHYRMWSHFRASTIGGAELGQHGAWAALPSRAEAWAALPSGGAEAWAALPGGAWPLCCWMNALSIAPMFWEDDLQK